MPSCVFRKCKNYGLKTRKDKGVTYHTFPTDELTRYKWVCTVRSERSERDWLPSKRCTICSAHFQEDDKYITEKGYVRLKKSAVPAVVSNQYESRSSESRASQQEDEYLSSGPNSPQSTSSRTKSGENAQTYYSSFAAKLRPSNEQMEVLVNFLEQNPKIAKGLVPTTEAKIEMNKKWTDVAVLINKAGDCIRDGEGWAKFWIEKKCALKRQLAPEVTEEPNSELETYSLMTSLEERMAALIETEELGAQKDSDTNAPLNVTVKSEDSTSFILPKTFKEERDTSPEPDNDLSCPVPATPELQTQVDDVQRDETQPVLSTSAASLSSQLQSVLELFVKHNPQIAEMVRFNVQAKEPTRKTPSIYENADSVTNANSAAKKRGRSDLPVPRAASPREHQTPVEDEEFSFTSNQFRIIHSYPPISVTNSRENNPVAIESQSSRNRTISRSRKTNSKPIRGTRPRFFTANDRLLAIKEKLARAELLRARTARESVAAWQSVSESINNLSQAVRFAGQQIADALNNRV